mgnify:CR=1 FL=1
MFLIEEELKKLPGKPGVYIMHGEKDEIIYFVKDNITITVLEKQILRLQYWNAKQKRRTPYA